MPLRVDMVLLLFLIELTISMIDTTTNIIFSNSFMCAKL